LTIHAQEIKVTDKDMSIKEIIYNENRVKVLNYSLKEFDALFLNFFDKIKITVDKTGILYLYHTNRYFSDRLWHCIQIKKKLLLQTKEMVCRSL
jgi:predicted oxidoreductase